jgi:hypothetical protein
MAKITRIKFNTNYMESGEVKYAKGEHYPKTPETTAQAMQGHAEEIEVDMEKETATAEAKAAAAKLAGERADTAAAEKEARDKGE